MGFDQVYFNFNFKKRQFSVNNSLSVGRNATRLIFKISLSHQGCIYQTASLTRDTCRMMKSKIRNAITKGGTMSLLGLSLTTGQGKKEDPEEDKVLETVGDDCEFIGELSFCFWCSFIG